MNGQPVTFRGVTKTYGGASRPALDGIDLDVAAGRILVLLGASGAGKTTLLRLVAGLESPDAGEIAIGERVVGAPGVCVPPERRGVGLVFQHLELWPHMTVAENIAFGLPGRPGGRRAAHDERVVSLATRVGVDAMLRRMPDTLSGGERQRVAIARTLAPDPTVVLYDEPLANLDPERRTDLRRLIRALCRERGATLLYVTHDADEGMAIGDEIAVLSRGRIVDRGRPEDLYRHPTTLEGARALGPVTALPASVGDGQARTVLGTHTVSGDRPVGDAWILLRPEALRAVAGQAARVVECRPAGPAWRIFAEREHLFVIASAETPFEPGDPVDFEVVGPACLVGAEETP